MTPSAEAPGPAEPVWTAAAVARHLGVAPGTLRSWSQRYGIGPAAHVPGRHRRYTAADLADLESVHALVTRGMTLVSAGAVVRDRRHPGAAGRSDARAPRGPAGDTATATRTPSVTDLVTASARLDSGTATAIVEAGLAQLGVCAAWERLFRPALEGLDPAVDDDLGCVDAQLLLSGVLTSRLHRAPTAPGGHPVLLACTAGEQHTLAHDVLSAALTERGVPTRALGAAVPAAALVHAAGLVEPRAVVVWARRTATTSPAVLDRLCEHSGLVLAAGPGWRHRDLGACAIRVDGLAAALDLIRTTSPARRRP